MIDWGYKIHDDRQQTWEEGDFTLWDRLAAAEPSVHACISCGTCASGCTTARYTPFSLRLLILLIQRGRPDEVKQEIGKCMLCGKCLLACPRNVNTRNVIIQVLKSMEENVLR